MEGGMDNGVGEIQSCLAFPAWGPGPFPFLHCTVQPAATSSVLGAIHGSQRHELPFSVPKVGSQLTGAGREGTVRRADLALSKLLPISPVARCCRTWLGWGEVFCPRRDAANAEKPVPRQQLLFLRRKKPL